MFVTILHQLHPLVEPIMLMSAIMFSMPPFVYCSHVAEIFKPDYGICIYVASPGA